jgi:hypothetical protein
MSERVIIIKKVPNGWRRIFQGSHRMMGINIEERSQEETDVGAVAWEEVSTEVLITPYKEVTKATSFKLER